MRVLLSGYDSRGGVEPLVALAVRLRELGAQVVVCAPDDAEFAQRLANVGVALTVVGQSIRAAVTGTTPPSPADLPRRAADVIARQLDTLMAAARDCDAVLGTGVLPAVVGARSVAEKLGIHFACATFQQLTLPSPHHSPLPYPGRPFPPDADNRTLWEFDAQTINDLFRDALNTNRASIGLPPVDDVRSYAFTDEPWLATDPILDPVQETLNIDVVQTGAWFASDDRPLPADLIAFLESGTPPVYVGFGSMPMLAAPDVARVVVDAIRAHGRRAVVARGWAELGLLDDAGDCMAVGEADHRALFGRMAAVVHHGGAGTTHTAARAGAPQVVVPQGADQPYWAGRVADLGIGVAHDGPIPTTTSLSAALDIALAAETRDRARSVADAIRTDGATVAATRLLDALNLAKPSV